ncbi:MAG: ATP-binding protein [Eubacteriales bacterium]|nr:ATP-binding protein [Eubacteriales bacterium]
MKELVTLTLPAKAEYMVTVRLVAASLAGQAGFDVECVEDIKTAVAEACLLLFPEEGTEAALHIEIDISHGIRATVYAPQAQTPQSTPEREFGSFLLEALMDEVWHTTENGVEKYILYKAA